MASKDPDPPASPYLLDQPFQDALTSATPFPATPPENSGVPLNNTDGPANLLNAVCRMQYGDGAADGTVSASGTQQKIWLTLPEAPAAAVTHRFLKIREVLGHDSSGNTLPTQTTVTPVTFTITPPSVPGTPPSLSSNAVELSAKRLPGGAVPGATTVIEKLVRFEDAPATLAANRDYNKGEHYDPLNAIGVISDAQTIGLKVVSKDVDGRYTVGQVITEGLHEGWFGVRARDIPNDFWDGATVTIRKLPGEDPETHLEDEGNVRFYATMGAGATMTATFIDHHSVANQVMDGPPNNLVGVVYGSSATVNPYATLWMEGITPGKITLEWRYKKGTLEFSHQQSFEVTTRQRKAYWQEILRRRIFLESHLRADYSNTEPPAVDIRTLDISKGFRENRYHVAALYTSYGQSFLQDETTFLCVGLAKRAGSQIYAGLSDAENGPELGHSGSKRFQEIR